LTCTRPRRTASDAALRVLNKRAAHSHLSIRTWSTTPMIAADDSRAAEVVAVSV
jgi:hypothetical protein